MLMLLPIASQNFRVSIPDLRSKNVLMHLLRQALSTGETPQQLQRPIDRLQRLIDRLQQLNSDRREM